MSGNIFGFDAAIQHLKAGRKVKRLGWNGKNQYVMLAYMQNCIMSDGTVIQDPEHEQIGSKFLMFVGTSGYQCGWLASQSDILAEDWVLV